MDIVTLLYDALAKDTPYFIAKDKLKVSLSLSLDSESADYVLNLKELLTDNYSKDTITEISDRLLDTELVDKILQIDEILLLSLNRNLVCEDLMEQVAQDNWLEKEKVSPKKFTVDMSSPNLGKTMTLTHLRSTTVGQSLTLMLRRQGHQVNRINHIGDWGIQFARLIIAYDKWGEEEYHDNPNVMFTNLQHRFYEESEFDPDIETQAIVLFNKLTYADKEALAKWEKICQLSYDQFKEIYAKMGVSFELEKRESTYNKEAVEIRRQLVNKGITIRDLDALTIQFPEEMNLPLALIQTGENDSLYLTRDLAAAIERQETYHATENIYVVGNEQSLHFQQLKAILEILEYNWAKSIHHVAIGYNSYKGRRLISGNGDVISVNALFNRVANRIQEWDGSLSYSEALRLGINTLIFESLKVERLSPFDIHTHDMINEGGNNSLTIENYLNHIQATLTDSESETSKEINNIQWAFIHHVLSYDTNFEEAVADYEPAVLGRYAYKLYRVYYQLEMQGLRTQDFDKLFMSVMTDVLTLLGLTLKVN